MSLSSSIAAFGVVDACWTCTLDDLLSNEDGGLLCFGDLALYLKVLLLWVEFLRKFSSGNGLEAIARASVGFALMGKVRMVFLWENTLAIRPVRGKFMYEVVVVSLKFIPQADRGGHSGHSQVAKVSVENKTQYTTTR